MTDQDCTGPSPSALSHRYELLIAIASGGMATVYVGRQFGAGGFERLVAIKRMHPHIAQSSELTMMFRDEAKIASLIQHPNVVAIHDVYEALGEQLLVMEYVDGVSLAQLRSAFRSDPKSIPLSVCFRVAVDILRGLDAAHELRDWHNQPLEVIHRDATPHNILLGSDGAIKIADFGIARAAARSSHTVTGQVKGKFCYLAPEQCRSGVMDRRVDIFSMGLVLWELLVGHRLFRGDSDAEIIAQIVAGQYPSPSSQNRALPPELDPLIMTALAVDPRDRYPTALAFAQAIESCAQRFGGLASTATIAQLVMQACGEKIQTRRQQVQEVLSGVRPGVPWGSSHVPAGLGTGSHSHAMIPSGVSLQPASLQQAPSLAAPAPSSPLSARKWTSWGAVGLLALVLVGSLWALRTRPSQGASGALPKTAPGPSVSAAHLLPSNTASAASSERIRVRVEADEEIVELRAPDGNDVELAGQGATFTAPRGTTPIVLLVRLRDGSELEESVTPTADAVIKVRHSTKRPGKLPPTLSAPAPSRPGPGPKYEDNPYE